MTVSVRGRRGAEESSLWITLCLTLVGKWGGKSLRPLEEQFREGDVEAKPLQLKGTKITRFQQLECNWLHSYLSLLPARGLTKVSYLCHRIQGFDLGLSTLSSCVIFIVVNYRCTKIPLAVGCRALKVCVLYCCFTVFAVGNQQFIDSYKYVCYPPNLRELWLSDEQRW